MYFFDRSEKNTHTLKHLRCRVKELFVINEIEK